jgi:cobalt-zinc-cadmium efflux system membrane fusion protein
VVRAPFAGTVVAAEVAVGEAVDTEHVLFTIADLSTVWVIGDVYQRDIGRVHVGQQAQIVSETYPGQTFTGRMTNVGDVIDSSTRTAKIRFEVPNANGRLKLQMFVRLQIPTAVAKPSLVLPVAAIQEIDGASVIFVQRSERTFERRAVETGPQVGGWVLISVGLKTGERVVTDGAFMLKSKLKAATIGEGEEEEKEKKPEKPETPAKGRGR